MTQTDLFAPLGSKDITSLKSAMKSDSTCGFDMKRVLDRTWMTVAEYRKRNPEMSEDDIRVAVSKSNLVLNDIPTATNNCMGDLIAESDEATAFATRDKLRKTFGGIVDDLIKSGTSNNGSYLKAKGYAFNIADKAFSFWAIWDPWSATGAISDDDTEDVTVNIRSGGHKIDEVDVPAGKTVTWRSNVTMRKNPVPRSMASGISGSPGYWWWIVAVVDS
ncbi:hypothetical protein PInf_011742 [Phytophthora infestans]|nr:hypothetical protein PInf_011742 [Phytophthora infestans]